VATASDIAVVAGYRTPFVRAGTVFRHLSAVHLGQVVTTELLQRSGCDPHLVDEVIFGNIGQPAEATNIARVIALRSGVPAERPAYTVQRNCASGMQAITSAAERILSGRAHVVVAGGTESMSQLPVQYPLAVNEWLGSWLRARTFAQRMRILGRFRLGLLKPRFALEIGLTDAYAGINMGKTAEVLAREFGIRREEQDAYACESHRRAVAAREKLGEEIVPVPTANLRQRIEEDNGPRADIALERLARMRPYFERRWGTVTIGNSCPITDGASAVLLMHRDRARELGYEALGYLRGWAYAGLEPQRMGLGPAYATPAALQHAKVRMAEIELIELNEAFAAQVLANLRVFERGVKGNGKAGLAPIGPIDRERLNVNGGAIALGHPVGASGTRLVVTLLREMQRRDQSLGLATLCVGGGQGAALVFERN
jgi:acetyl-CoA C-acetyltransferase/acetyl-CoA acyltransferase